MVHPIAPQIGQQGAHRPSCCLQQLAELLQAKSRKLLPCATCCHESKAKLPSCTDFRFNSVQLVFAMTSIAFVVFGYLPASASGPHLRAAGSWHDGGTEPPGGGSRQAGLRATDGCHTAEQGLGLGPDPFQPSSPCARSGQCGDRNKTPGQFMASRSCSFGNVSPAVLVQHPESGFSYGQAFPSRSAGLAL